MKKNPSFRTLRNMIASLFTIATLTALSTTANAQTNEISTETRAEIENVNKQMELDIKYFRF